MDATSLASVWATVALFVFLGILVYLKVPGMISKALDARATKIQSDLNEARRLREEAQALLAEFQQKRKEAEKEAADIVTAAKREAEMLLADAHKKTEDYVSRRTAMAEQKSGARPSWPQLSAIQTSKLRRFLSKSSCVYGSE